MVAVHAPYIFNQQFLTASYLGFPHPENIRLATELESLVRKHGAVPATIGVLHGVARVGFTLAELNELTRSAGEPGTKKLSRRDLGYVCGLVIFDLLLFPSRLTI